MPFNPSRVGIPPAGQHGGGGGATAATPRTASDATTGGRFRASRGGGGGGTSVGAGRIRPRPGGGGSGDPPIGAAARDVPARSNTTRGAPSSGNAAATGGNPIWVKTSLLDRHHVSGAGGAALGLAARRQFGRDSNRRMMDGGATATDGGENASGGRSGLDWGWVRGWAIPAAGGISAANNDANGTSAQSTSLDADGPASPFGHVKLRRVGSSAASRLTNNEHNGAKSPAFVHRSNSTPLPNGRRQQQQNIQEDSSKPVLPLTITIQDEDYPSYTGRTLTLSSDEVRDGTAPANTWWSTTDVTATTPMLPPDDLIELTHLHEPAVVHCLRTRYDGGEVYTSTGPILLACNPFRTVAGLYSAEMMRRYWQRQGDDGVDRRPPHAFGVADAAFRAMMRAFEDNRLGGIGDQSILVSGESGAGKTVTTKIVMRYLATLSQQQSGDDCAGIGGGEGGTEGQVLQSNPILESFGNARTIRNDNSSRFGKFIEMQFRRSGTLTGAAIETYLLEKVRLITQGRGERNFHILYEIFAGASQPEKSTLGLRHATPEDFVITSVSGTFDRRDGVSDASTYADLKKAMTTVGFSSEEQLEILSVPAAMLFCSNLSFLEGRSHDGSSWLDESNPSLPNALRLLGVTADALNDALCTSHIEVAGEVLRKVLSRDQAAKALEAFMMATYGALFRYIVDQINSSITFEEPGSVTSVSSSSAIRILDIFGFESFAVNSFEQLCINYCNETLQSQFNQYVFKLEQQEYEREGIEWSFIDFPDNQEVLDLIEKKRTGIISILDEQCRLTKCTDQSFVAKTYEICADHPRFIGSDRSKALGCFSVQHYAGPVEYNSESFLAKNKDELPKETTDLLLSSSRPLLQDLGEMLSVSSSSSSAPSPVARGSPYLKRSASSLSRASVGNQFSSQLRQLRDRIDKTAPHYIKCLKPNDELVPDNFVPSIIADQLRCAGVLEAVRVSRVGFPQRYLHSLFVQRYGILGGHTFDSAKRCQQHDLCHILVDALVPQIWNHQHGRLPAKDLNEAEEFAHDLLSVGVQIGTTKVFLRQQAFEALELLRAERLAAAATKIQSAVRMYLCVDSYMFILESVIMIQTVFRGYRARNFVETVRYFYRATIIQAAWRRFIAYDDYANTRSIALWGQRRYRGRVARANYATINQDRKAVVLQSFWRMAGPYRRFRAAVRLVINIQQLFRSRRARNLLKQLKSDARNLNHVARERDELRREALRAKQELEDLRHRSRRQEDEERALLQASDSNSVDQGAHSSVAGSSQVSSVIYRDFPKTPTAQEAEIRALADACTAKDMEMERLRQELESIKEEKGEELPPIKTVFARNRNLGAAAEENESSAPDTPAATEAESTTSSTPLSAGIFGSPSKRSLAMNRVEFLMGRQGTPTDAESHGSSANDVSQSQFSDSPRKYSLRKAGSREMAAYRQPNTLNASFNNDEVETPLHQIIRSGDVDALVHFISSCDDMYAYINEGGHHDRTPLHLAVLNSNFDMTSILLEHFAVPNLQDDAQNTPLHYAQSSDMIETLLVAGGANPNIPNENGLCALHLAVRRKDVDAVRLLLAHRADVSVADSVRWFTPLHLVAHFDGPYSEIPYESSVSSNLSPSGEIAQMLCMATDPAEVDINYQDRDGNSPLHLASVVDNECADELITILLSQGSDPNIVNERGQSPMHLICHNKGQRRRKMTYRQLIDTFLSYGANPNLPSLSGCTPLHLCIYHKDIDGALQLLQAGGQLHLPWRKPPSWKVFWADAGLPDVLCTDMITNQGDLRRVLSAISIKQATPPARPTCMRCLNAFGPFGKKYCCGHCSSLVCRRCSSANLDASELPAFCRNTDTTMTCNLCEDIILSRLGSDY